VEFCGLVGRVDAEQAGGVDERECDAAFALRARSRRPAIQLP
jgi:hypothetical protein